MATTDGSASGFPLEEVRRSAQAMAQTLRDAGGSTSTNLVRAVTGLTATSGRFLPSFG
jgi:phosphoribosylformimino-5-aminoimidazole carboxamide ribonucleotide (ProFAR) isomerase